MAALEAAVPEDFGLGFRRLTGFLVLVPSAAAFFLVDFFLVVAPAAADPEADAGAGEGAEELLPEAGVGAGEGLGAGAPAGGGVVEAIFAF